MIIKCDSCGKEHYKKPSKVIKSKNNFCCKNCFDKYRHDQIVNNFSEQLGKDFEEWLIEKYITEQATTRQISMLLYGNDKCFSSVNRWLKVFEIPIRHGSEAIKTQWINADERRKKTSEHAKDNLHTNDVIRKRSDTQQTDEFKEKMSKNRLGEENPYYKHGKTKTRLYNIWRGMKKRCYNLNNKDYKHYGDRGIRICDQWLKSFKSFFEWAIKNGYSENLSIDRIDNDGNYEPFNCRWSNAKEQRRNQRTNT